jgi:hypothetical protein
MRAIFTRAVLACLLFFLAGSYIQAQVWTRKPNEKAGAMVKRLTKKECEHAVLEIDFGNTEKGKKIIYFQRDSESFVHGYILFPAGISKYEQVEIGTFNICFPLGDEILSVFTDDLENDGVKELFVLSKGTCGGVTEDGLPATVEEYYTKVFRQKGKQNEVEWIENYRGKTLDFAKLETAVKVKERLMKMKAKKK